MKNYALLKTGTKALSISAAITTLGTGICIMIAFLLCFIQETSFSFPFNLVDIITKQDGDGYYTSIVFGNNLFSIGFIVFLVISILLFVIFYFTNKTKQQKQANN
jgi:hypothetical protein